MLRALSDKLLIAALAAGITLRICYCLYVQPMWEDSLITLRVVDNLIHNGTLSYNHPEPVYAFTSPFNALLIMYPAQALFEQGVNAVRLASLLAFAASLILAYYTALTAPFRLSRVGLAIWLGLIAVYVPGIYFPMGGMESQFAVLAAFAALYATLNERDGLLGIAGGIGLLVRPDMAIFIASSVVLRAFKKPMAAVKSGLIMTLIYGPWLVFSWLYFGSPVPHTVTAKSLIDKPDMTAGNYWWTLQKIFSPTTSSGLGGLTDFIAIATTATSLTLLSVSAWSIWQSARPHGRNEYNWWKKSRGIAYLFCAPAYVIAFSLYMAFAWAHAPWYHIPAFLIAAGAIAHSYDYLARFRWPGKHPLLAVVLTMGFAVPHIGYAALKIYRDRLVQQHIENDVRAKTGGWLQANVPAGETVYLEALGYIGYYAGLQVNIVDWPGLASPATVAALRTRAPENRYLPDLILPLKPDWIVMRPYNYRYALGRNDSTARFLRECYVEATTISLSPTAPRLFFLQGHMDAQFTVLRRVNFCI